MPKPINRPVSPSPFPSLHPIRSTLSRYQSPPPRSDGLDNFPVPLSSDPVALERRLTQDPEIERQMADGDVGPPPEGGREAWAVVAGAFFVLFCVFGFGELALGERQPARESEGELATLRDARAELTAATSFGQLEIYYLENQLAGYSKSEVA